MLAGLAPRGVRSALAWFAFPLVPALLGIFYHDTCNIGFTQRGGPDPREWNGFSWLLLIGPMLGYGFLAGATISLDEESSDRRLRRWLNRRWVRVGVGPWVGGLLLAAIYFTAVSFVWAVNRIHPPSRDWANPLPQIESNSWASWVLGASFFIILAYGWIPIAALVLKRACRQGEFLRSLRNGLLTAAGFVGSLFGSFWAVTEFWRDYFFDKKIIPILIVGSSLVMMSGCASTITYGEVRRRELFQAFLVAWLLGLALAWRWWSRPRARS